MISIFLYAFLISLFTLILVIFLSHKYQLFIDDSNEKKPQNFHEKSTPRAGGLGILLGMSLLLVLPLGLKFFLSIFLAFLSGIVEDFHNSLSPKFRLSLQIAAAFFAIWLTNSVVTYLGLGINMPYWMGVIFSVFAIVGMMNAMNMIDGFHGLASGVILLILLSFAIVSYRQDNLEILSIVIISLGATLGFFILNFPKGKIFLGDGGAYLLGFIVAIIGIFLASKYESVSPWYVLAIFIYPVWEVVFSIIRRLVRGHSALGADANHLHTLIYKHITHNNPLTTLIILVTTLPFMTIATIYPNLSKINLAVICCFILFYSIFYHYLYKKEKKYLSR